MNDKLFKRIGKECRKQTENLYSEELCGVSGFALGKVVGFKRGFYKGAEYAVSHQWISVEESLPELEERVLVAYRGINRISICIMRRIPHDSSNPNNREWHWSLTSNKEDVIAWMPIPKYRKEERL